MDMGLNNRNTLSVDTGRKEFDDMVFIVEANSNEAFSLWQDWAKGISTNIEPLTEKEMDDLIHGASIETYKKLSILNRKVKANYHNRVDWVQITAGFMIQVGEIKIRAKKMPVMVEWSFAIINGKKVGFYNCCSMVGHSKMVEDFIRSRFQLTHDNYTRWNHTDAQNFHNCVHSLDNLDKEPRNTVYKGN